MNADMISIIYENRELVNIIIYLLIWRYMQYNLVLTKAFLI